MVSQMLDCRYKLAYYAHRGRLDDDGLVAEACWPLGKCKCKVRWLSLPGEQEKLCLHKTKKVKNEDKLKSSACGHRYGATWHPHWLTFIGKEKYLWNLHWYKGKIEKNLGKISLHGSFLLPTGPSWGQGNDNYLETLWVRRNCRNYLCKFRPPSEGSIHDWKSWHRLKAKIRDQTHHNSLTFFL